MEARPERVRLGGGQPREHVGQMPLVDEVVKTVPTDAGLEQGHGGVAPLVGAHDLRQRRGVPGVGLHP